jgi:hypothetical protein
MSTEHITNHGKGEEEFFTIMEDIDSDRIEMVCQLHGLIVIYNEAIINLYGFMVVLIS